MSFDIIGLGEVVVDWVATVDHFPDPDEKIDSTSQQLFSGGVTANYAVAAARIGAKTQFIGAVGNDQYADFLKKDFKDEGVNFDYLIDKSAPTPVNFIFVVQESGEKVIIQSPYMYSTVPTIADIQENGIKNGKLLHTTGIYPEVTKKAFEIAKAYDLQITFDLEKQIVLRGKKNLMPLLNQVDILCPNKMGALELTGAATPIDAAKKFLDWGIKVVVITLGDQGAVAITKNGKIQVPAMKITPVDTTGAGDTFCAAFDYVYAIKQWEIEDALKFANAAAALKIGKLGARTGMPSYNQVMEYLEHCKIRLNSV